MEAASVARLAMKRVYPSPGLYTAIVRDVARPRAARFAANAYVLPDAFRWTRGESVVVRYDLPEARSFRVHFAASADRRSRMAPGAVKKSLYRRGRLTMTRGPPLQRMSTGVRARGGPFGPTQD